MHWIFCCHMQKPSDVWSPALITSRYTFLASLHVNTFGSLCQDSLNQTCMHALDEQLRVRKLCPNFFFLASMLVLKMQLCCHSFYNKIIVKYCFLLQVSNLKSALEGVEKERDYYFEKLREVEVLCQEQAGEETTFAKQLLEVLYSSYDQVSLWLQLSLNQSPGSGCTSVRLLFCFPSL